MNRNPTATFWLFGYGGITGSTHLCVVRDALDWPNLTHNVVADDALICRSRSRVASSFLEDLRREAGEVLLMVDHDIQWEPGDLAYIARRALEQNAIVAGIYPKRVFGDGSASRFDAVGTFKIGSDDLIPSQYVGSGFVAVPRIILGVVAETLPRIAFPQTRDYWPFYLPLVVPIEGGQEMLSEDWAFCERANALGFKCYSACRPRLTHEGHYTFRLVDAKAKPPPAMDLTITLSSAAFAAREKTHA